MKVISRQKVATVKEKLTLQAPVTTAAPHLSLIIFEKIKVYFIIIIIFIIIINNVFRG